MDLPEETFLIIFICLEDTSLKVKFSSRGRADVKKNYSLHQFYPINRRLHVSTFLFLELEADMALAPRISQLEPPLSVGLTSSSL